jgi:hypothetical protein
MIKILQQKIQEFKGKKVKYYHYRPGGLWGSGRLRLQNF